MNTLLLKFSLYFHYYRGNTSIGATNVYVNNDTQTCVTFSSCISRFPEKPHQSLKLNFPARAFANDLLDHLNLNGIRYILGALQRYT